MMKNYASENFKFHPFWHMLPLQCVAQLDSFQVSLLIPLQRPSTQPHQMLLRKLFGFRSSSVNQELFLPLSQQFLSSATTMEPQLWQRNRGFTKNPNTSSSAFILSGSLLGKVMFLCRRQPQLTTQLIHSLRRLHSCSQITILRRWVLDTVTNSTSASGRLLVQMCPRAIIIYRHCIFIPMAMKYSFDLFI